MTLKHRTEQSHATSKHAANSTKETNAHESSKRSTTGPTPHSYAEMESAHGQRSSGAPKPHPTHLARAVNNK